MPVVFGQVRKLGSATLVLADTPIDVFVNTTNLYYEVTNIRIVNNGINPTSFNLYHDEKGQNGYVNATEVEQDSVDNGKTFRFDVFTPGAGFALGPQDKFGLSINTIGPVTITVYGVQASQT